MKHLPLPHTDLQLSSVIHGCWQADSAMWPGAREDDIIAAMRAAFDAGVTTFDTAEDYGGGHSERLLGRALAGHRDEIVIASKVSWDHLRPEQIVAACERSLENLGSERIDLYQIHWPAGTFGSERVPLAESLGALLELRSQGKIRAIGVSNFDRAQLEQACQLAPIATVQPPYSLLWRGAERELVPVCRERGVALLAYSPLAQGLLAGGFTPERRLAPGDNRADNKLFQAPVYEHALRALDALRPIAEELGASLAQLALAWVSSLPEIAAAAIAGARTPAQARDNAAAGALRLSAEHRAQLDRISRQVPGVFDEHPVMWTWET
ncbi:aldo/keto reductase [Haliangium ochraceum]|uniref:Aldo/keto reductase n=1 Tax=Haliangium ochraceum (strain DSM 14365 / JCM 11303 / SMP-2) TaxID=502025 RepID=D0LTN3_HALO1|nr:aldo/keto reductase [Haliangium ochraceum]ACY15727.1 aldo/keto reductase [Haliangium ochraceum DSM 14365]